MEHKRIRDIEGYEAFKAECSFFRCEEEYPGWTGNEKYGIITGLSKEELEAKFPQFIKAMSPYVLLDLEYGEIRAEAKRNDDKFEKRERFSNSLFELDEEAEAMNPELSVPNFLTEELEKQKHIAFRKKQIAICRGMLAQLSDVQKKRLLMKYILHKTETEIAEIEGTSQQAISKSLILAEKKFSEIYESGLYFDNPNSMHYEGVNSILKRITASTKIENDEN